MKNHLIALLLLASAAGCGEDPEPPRRTVAPEPKSIVKSSDPVKVQSDRPPNPPPPPSPDRKPEPKAPDAPPAPVNKVLLDPSLPEWIGQAPAEFKAKFTTSKGDFTIQVTREWSPRGADRFYALVKNGYFDGVVFFRVIAGFMAQFGLHGSPEVNSAWRNATIQDDPVTQSNKRGMVTYAKRGPNTRTTQLFINFSDKNDRLDSDGFSPFGRVVEGMDVVDQLYNGYGEGAPRGLGPDQGRIQAEGNEYLKSSFKELDYVKTARIVP
ncbi:MAG TPA: peptidylprolyl isomerase [Planctomycetota bacterium]|nr:peptidylprolyl isomerase [Planctomycetota bacterium]